MKTIISLFILLLAFWGYSQSDITKQERKTNLRQKHIIYFGFEGALGTFSMTKTTSENGIFNNLSLSINPHFGYFVTRKLVAGLNFNLSYTKSYDQYSVFKNRSMSFGPFLKYYFINKSITPFALLRYNVGDRSDVFSLSTNDEETFFVKYSFYRMDIGSGVAFFLTNKILFEAELDYSYKKYKPEKGVSFQKSNIWGTKLGLVLFL